MSRRAETEAWESFHRQMARFRLRLDGMVPLALVCVPAIGDERGEIQVDLGDGATIAIVWPPGLSKEQKADCLERAANGIRAGAIS